ncbi:MAG: twin-arginine translocase TatA/TatE family subunit [Bacteroidetes bacterium 4572_112]|nr:MAG: twin-arginine translocase TatA/TatE family subunit [Bacteroidetes bacterium 4572_112]
MINTILLGMFGGSEIMVVLVLVVLLFGGKKIPELMRGLGKGMKEFKDATKDIKEEINDATGDIKKEIKDIDPIGELRK